MSNTTLGAHHYFGKSLTRAQSISLVLHGVLIAVLLIPAIAPPPDILGIRDTPLIFPGLKDLNPWKAEAGNGRQNRGGGGGGARDFEAATAGSLPRFTPLQFTPPGRPRPDAELVMAPTLKGPNFTPPAAYAILGDPTSKKFNGSQGPGGGNGHGNGCCGGNGPGEGRGHGPGKDQWTGGEGESGIHVAGRGVGTPVCTYCPNPTFTEEAIRVKYQGAVTLRLVVTAEGLPTNISVVRTAGLGLDERATETVRTWRFTPARDRNGRPVATWVLIEVQFRQF